MKLNIPINLPRMTYCVHILQQVTAFSELPCQWLHIMIQDIYPLTFCFKNYAGRVTSARDSRVNSTFKVLPKLQCEVSHTFKIPTCWANCLIFQHGSSHIANVPLSPTIGFVKLQTATSQPPQTVRFTQSSTTLQIGYFERSSHVI